jgi:hypothetical protein
LIPSLSLVVIPLVIVTVLYLLSSGDVVRYAKHTWMIPVPAVIFFIVYLFRYGSAKVNFTMWILTPWESKEAPIKTLIHLYKVLNIILYAESAGLIIITILLYSNFMQFMNSPYILVELAKRFPLQIALFSGIYSVFLYFYGTGYYKKDFQFIFGRKCISVADIEADYAKKINYLLAALTSYNKYLKRNFTLEFDESRVASNIISSDDKNQKVKEIAKSFSVDDDYRRKPNFYIIQQYKLVDKLKPASCISTFANMEPKIQFLTAKHLSTRIKEVLMLLAAIIPAGIGVIELVNAVT